MAFAKQQTFLYSAFIKTLLHLWGDVQQLTTTVCIEPKFFTIMISSDWIFILT